MGSIATQAKARFDTAALDDDHVGDEDQNEPAADDIRVAMSLHRGYTRKTQAPLSPSHVSQQEYQSDGTPRKPKRKCQLSTEQIGAVVHSVRRDKLSHKEAAIKHGVSTRLVQSLVMSSRRDDTFLEKHRKREEKRRQHEERER